MIYFPSLSTLKTFCSIGTEKVMYFSIFSLKQVNYPSDSSTKSSIMKL